MSIFTLNIISNFLYHKSLHPYDLHGLHFNPNRVIKYEDLIAQSRRIICRELESRYINESTDL